MDGRRRRVLLPSLGTLTRHRSANPNQTKSYQEALERNRKVEKQSETFQDQLKHLEEELLSIDMIQDGLKLEKQKVGTRIILFCIKISKV